MEGKSKFGQSSIFFLKEWNGMNLNMELIYWAIKWYSMIIIGYRIFGMFRETLKHSQLHFPLIGKSDTELLR